MKRVEAIIKEETLEAIKDGLEAAGFTSMTIFNCRGRGTSGGINLEWRVGTYRVDFLHKILLMLIIKDEEVNKVTDIIINVCKADETGGAGKIIISPIEDVIRIRTGERGHNAI